MIREPPPYRSHSYKDLDQHYLLDRVVSVDAPIETRSNRSAAPCVCLLGPKRGNGWSVRRNGIGPFWKAETSHSVFLRLVAFRRLAPGWRLANI